MRLAQRMSRIEESATLLVTRRVKALQAQGIELVDLGAGEPDFPSPQVAIDAACEALRSGHTRYTQVGGDPELRAALAERFAASGARWTVDDVLITVGAKAALLELALALVDRDDEVVIPNPCWVSLPEQVRLAGGDAVLVETSSTNGFEISAEDLLAAITPRTRAVLVNSPCNPTGGVIGASALRALVAECAERDILVISDETYDRFVYDGREHASIADLADEFPDTCVLVGSFSKTYAMTGWRLGYVLGPDPVINAVRSVQSHATSNATSFAMRGALAALRGAEDEVSARLVEYEARRDLVSDGLAAIPGVALVPPAGTFYAFPDVSALYRPGLEDSVSLSTYLLDNARVVVVPGAAFGADDHVRLSFAASRAELEEGLARLAGALDEEALDRHLRAVTQ